ncbi:MAG: TatD family hydrolase, partial [Deferribacteres bacterium]|nr:TatD family hydrolase [Deferribacteres bacterium]
MRLIDTHCHLHMDYYKKDRDEVIKRAFEQGMVFMLTVGISTKDSKKAYALAHKYHGIYASAGIHPHDAKSACDNDFEEIRKLCQSNKVVAIGEIGLDFYRNLSPKNVQAEVFERLLTLAQELNIPVIIHTRDAHKETKETLKRFDVKGIIHCFSGDKSDAKDYLDMGFYISFAGNITYGNRELEDAAKAV